MTEQRKGENEATRRLGCDLGIGIWCLLICTLMGRSAVNEKVRRGQAELPGLTGGTSRIKLQNQSRVMQCLLCCSLSAKSVRTASILCSITPLYTPSEHPTTSSPPLPGFSCILNPQSAVLGGTHQKGPRSNSLRV